MFWRKGNRVEEMLDNYFGECDRCFELVEKAFDTLMKGDSVHARYTEAIAVSVAKP